MLPRDLEGGAAMAGVVSVDCLERAQDVLDGLEGEEPAAGRQDLGEAGVLGDDGPSGGQVAGAPVAEPSAAWSDVLILGDREFAARAQDVLPVRDNVLRQGHGIDGPPAVAANELDRFVVSSERELERLGRPPGQLDELEELCVLAPDVRLAVPLDV